MVVSTDPCTGAPIEWFGWLLIHYSASDVALFGAKPRLASINLLGPIGTSYRTYKRIMDQACQAADKLQIDIITGHTGNYTSMSQIVGICTMQGFVEKNQLITPENSQSNDLILMIKSLGLETLTNFALTHYTNARKFFGFKNTRDLRSLVKYQTCVEEALQLAKLDGVHSMHDTTEGGLIAALNEMGDTSHLGFEIVYENIPMRNELNALQKYFKLTVTELLSLSSTGGLIAAISPKSRSRVLHVLNEKKVVCKIIGRFTKKKNRKLIVKKHMIDFPQVAKDPYTKIFYSEH
jgi:hydrogenase maturation factor